MKKVKSCPSCGGTSIGDRWCSGRRLQYYCKDDDCRWFGSKRIPEKRKIIARKEEYLHTLGGHNYIIYDRYGHISTLSRTYNSVAEAMKAMQYDLLQGENNPDAGPYTGVLFNTPTRIMIKGKMFQSKGGKLIRKK